MNFKFEAPKQEAPQEDTGKGSESVLELARKGSALIKAHQEKNPGTIESASQSDDSEKTSEQDDEVLSYHKQAGPSTKEEILKDAEANKSVKSSGQNDEESLSYHKQRGPSTKEEILKESDSNKNEAWPV